MLDKVHNPCYALRVMLSTDYTILSIPVQKDALKKFKKMHPEYGSVASVMRMLFKMYIDGKIRVLK